MVGAGTLTWASSVLVPASTACLKMLKRMLQGGNAQLVYIQSFNPILLSAAWSGFCHVIATSGAQDDSRSQRSLRRSKGKNGGVERQVQHSRLGCGAAQRKRIDDSSGREGMRWMSMFVLFCVAAQVELRKYCLQGAGAGCSRKPKGARTRAQAVQEGKQDWHRGLLAPFTTSVDAAP